MREIQFNRTQFDFFVFIFPLDSHTTTHNKRKGKQTKLLRYNHETMNQFTFWYENCLMSGLFHSFRHDRAKNRNRNKTKATHMGTNRAGTVQSARTHTKWTSTPIDVGQRNEWEEKRFSISNDDDDDDGNKTKKHFAVSKVRLSHRSVSMGCANGKWVFVPEFFLIGMFNTVIVLLISLLLSHLIDWEPCERERRTRNSNIQQHRCGIFASIFFPSFVFASPSSFSCMFYFNSQTEEQQLHTLLNDVFEQNGGDRAEEWKWRRQSMYVR